LAPQNAFCLFGKGSNNNNNQQNMFNDKEWEEIEEKARRLISF